MASPWLRILSLWAAAAVLLAVVSGYKIIYQAMLDLLNRRLSADLAIAVAAIAAVAVGEYFAAA